MLAVTSFGGHRDIGMFVLLKVEYVGPDVIGDIDRRGRGAGVAQSDIARVEVVRTVRDLGNRRRAQRGSTPP